MGNHLSKILLLALTVLLVVIYFQNLSLKRELQILKRKIEEIKIEKNSSFFSEEIPTKKITYVGNSKTFKFHLSDCQWARKINPINKVYFNSKEEALRKGYKPCKVCNP